MRYSFPLLVVALLSVACGDDSPINAEIQQPGGVPTPTATVSESPSPDPSVSGRDWSVATLEDSPCPPPQPGQPACLAVITQWSVDDEGEIRPDEGPGAVRISQRDLQALDSRIDAVKNGGDLVCTGGSQEPYNKAVALAFEDGFKGLFYTLNSSTSQECYRASLDAARALLAQMAALKEKYSGVAPSPSPCSPPLEICTSGE